MRQTNFYWAKYHGKWFPGEWRSDGEYWLLPGYIMEYWDDDFSEIIETPINQPGQEAGSNEH